MTKLAILLLLMSLVGCVMNSKPRRDLGFADVATLKSFEGCYQNVGETGKNAPRRVLSAVIFPTSGLDDNKISAVRVELIAEDSVQVSAILDRRVVRQETFVQGKDFKFDAGQIVLESEPHGAIGADPGNPFVGVGYSKRVIGVDLQGNGRMLDSAAFAGTAFLVIPMVGSASDATRFRRSPDLCAQLAD